MKVSRSLIRLSDCADHAKKAVLPCGTSHDIADLVLHLVPHEDGVDVVEAVADAVVDVFDVRNSSRLGRPEG